MNEPSIGRQESTFRESCQTLMRDATRFMSELLIPTGRNINEPVRSEWQEVGDDLRDAMQRYPLSVAAKDAEAIRQS